MAKDEELEVLIRVGNVEQLTELLRNRSDIGVWVCAVATRRLAAETIRLQLLFNSIATANGLGISEQNREDLRNQRAVLHELIDRLDAVLAAYQPQWAEPHEDTPS